MRVAIVTFHAVPNFGAVLQCLALQRALQALGHEVEVLDYQPASMKPLPFWRGLGIREGMLIKNLPGRWIKMQHGKAMEHAFCRFRKDYLTLSPRCETAVDVAELADQYDAFVAGSDQVWHFQRESVYFLDWGRDYAGKRISYAPCCGTKEQPTANREKIACWVNHVDHISVRNSFSYDLIHGLTGREPAVVADPTLLVDMDDVAHSVDLPCSDYILMYTLSPEIEGGHRAVIQSIRARMGDLPVVAVVPSAHKPHRAPWADHVIYDAGPGEWVYLVNQAAFVYTDSFHGVLFALKGQRPFLAYYAEAWRAPRLVDLAERYGLESRIVSKTTEASVALESDWDASATYQRIDEHVELSMHFLRKVLDE